MTDKYLDEVERADEIEEELEDQVENVNKYSKEYGPTIEPKEKKRTPTIRLKKTPEAKRVEKVMELVKNDSSLEARNGRVYFAHETPDGKMHSAYVTITKEKNMDIKDKPSLDKWKDKMTKFLDKKYSK